MFLCFQDFDHMFPTSLRLPPTASNGFDSTGNASNLNGEHDGIVVNIAWPTDILTRFLAALAVQCNVNAQRSWNQLAYLVCKRDDLAEDARLAPRPITFRIELVGKDRVFKIPFDQATVVCVDIDWGDGCVEKLRQNTARCAQHKYAAAGGYTVCVFPASDAPGVDGVWLDHLGFVDLINRESTVAWWQPLREIVTLGRCGLRSLSFLFSFCLDLKADLTKLLFGDISDMSGLFCGASSFNQPIGGWDVSNVTNMSLMFWEAEKFDQPIGDWDVSKVIDMSNMFEGAREFNQPIGGWDVGNVTNMISLFQMAKRFNQPIGEWDVSRVVDMRHMFSAASAFNQPIGDWDVGNVANMSFMLWNVSEFDQPIGKWNVGNVTDMGFMFYGASAFNHPVGAWNVSNVTSLVGIFQGASSFNQPIGEWNVSNVTDMSFMFYRASAFNQPIGQWSVGNVIVMRHIFYLASAFNQPIGGWNVGSVTDMEYMFYYASAFNQPIDTWNIENVSIMSHMFYGTTALQQPLVGCWDLTHVLERTNMFSGSRASNKRI
jgi:surface protein